MNKDKKKRISSKIIKFIFSFFLLSFLTIYISQLTGYYEYEQHKKMQLTEEQIKKFESDVKAGKDIDINNYYEEYEKDYQNSISKMGLKISNTISKGIQSGVEGTFNFLIKLMEG